MTLYEFWNKTVYHQDVWIYLTNAYGQNMPLYSGSREEWRSGEDDDDKLYWHLMDEIDHWEITDNGDVLVLLKDDTYEKRMEDEYFYSDRWGPKKEERPWRHFAELEAITGEKYEWHYPKKEETK